MKKYLLALSILFCLTFASCSVPDSDANLPTEVNKLKALNQFDTVLVIRTDAKIYQFDYKTKALITSDSTKKDSDDSYWFGFLLVIVIILVIL